MGFYIDVMPDGVPIPGTEKMSILTEKYTKLTRQTDKALRIDGLVPVVIMDNGAFQAALICDSLQEIVSALDPRDPRARVLVLIPEEDIEKMNPHALKPRTPV